jgi:hypothetical protein
MIAETWEHVKLLNSNRSHRKESYNLMKQTLHEFFGHEQPNGAWVRGYCGAATVEQVRRVDLLRYRAWCIDDKKRSARTAANKMLRVNPVRPIRPRSSRRERAGHHQGWQVH